MKHFVYQRIHTLAGKALHLDTHLDLAARAFQHIYGGDRPELDERAVAARITECLRTHRSPAKGSATVMLRLAPRDNYELGITNRRQAESHRACSNGRGAKEEDEVNYEFTIEYERTLLDAGYSLSALRPRAVSYEYDIPFGGFPTGFQLSAAALFDTLALSHHGATRSVRRDGNRLLSCGDAPLFGIRGKTLFTAPLTEGAIESVERRMVIAAATRNYELRTDAKPRAIELARMAEARRRKTKSITNYDKSQRPPLRLDFLEEAILHSELTDFDELFFADAAGITSLSECDGAKFMSLIAARLAAAMR